MKARLACEGGSLCAGCKARERCYTSRVAGMCGVSSPIGNHERTVTGGVDVRNLQPCEPASAC
jgi:hypothetical protein